MSLKSHRLARTGCLLFQHTKLSRVDGNNRSSGISKLKIEVGILSVHILVCWVSEFEGLFVGLVLFLIKFVC